MRLQIFYPRHIIDRLAKHPVEIETRLILCTEEGEISRTSDLCGEGQRTFIFGKF